MFFYHSPYTSSSGIYVENPLFRNCIISSDHISISLTLHPDVASHYFLSGF